MPRALPDNCRGPVIAGRLLSVTGRIERDGAVIHLIAERIEDLSGILSSLARRWKAGTTKHVGHDPHSNGDPRSPAPPPPEPAGK